MVDQKPVRLIAVTSDDRVNNRFMLPGGAAQCVGPLQMIGAVRCKPPVERAGLFLEIVVVRACVDCFVERFVQFVAST
jgi:hypothetical protein